MTAISRRTLGSGPDLVLVHGWGLHSGIWGGLAPELAQHFRVILVDLPGHGLSAAVPPGDIDTCADALAALVPQTAIWVGWSLGATLLLQLCARHRRKVDRLVLVGATPCFLRSANWSCGMEAEVFAAFAADLRNSYRPALQRFLTLQLGPGEESRALVRSMRTELFRHGEPDPAGLEAALEILRRADLRDLLPQLRVPSLVIHGARDRLVPVAAAQYLAEGLGAGMRILDTAGHVPFLSHPAEFRAALGIFLHD